MYFAFGFIIIGLGRGTGFRELNLRRYFLQIGFIYLQSEKQFISHFNSLALNCKSSPAAVFDILLNSLRSFVCLVKTLDKLKLIRREARNSCFPTNVVLFSLVRALLQEMVEAHCQEGHHCVEAGHLGAVLCMLQVPLASFEE